MRLKNILIIAAIIVVAAVATWILTTRESGEPSQLPLPAGRARAPLAVNALIASPVDFTEEITLTGTILANEAVVIKPEISGRIVEIGFKEGQRVRKGQMLARLFDADLQARLRQTNSQIELDSESVHRLEQIRRVDGVSIEELQRAKATLAMHRAEADVIRAQIEKTVIKAPFHGVVGLRNVSEGAVVSPETEITLLKDDSRLKLECTVPEKYASKIAVGSVMSFRVRGTSSAHTYAATVYAQDPELDPASRTLRVRASIANAEGLMPGMFTDILLVLGRIGKALLVPTEAVVVDLKGAKVFVNEGGIARERRIVTGTRTRDKLRVESGISIGDTVLTTGMLIMKDGLPVKITIVGDEEEGGQ